MVCIPIETFENKFSIPSAHLEYRLLNSFQVFRCVVQDYSIIHFNFRKICSQNLKIHTRRNIRLQSLRIQGVYGLQKTEIWVFPGLFRDLRRINVRLSLVSKFGERHKWTHVNFPATFDFFTIKQLIR